MADPGDIARIVADCERYWRRTGVPRSAISDMRLELEAHLAAAAAEGRDPSVVVGHDLVSFAEAWASEHRSSNRQPGGVASARDTDDRRRDRRLLIAYVAGSASLVAGVVAGNLAAGGGDNVDNELWRWLWTGFALVMGIGEIFTAGFFLLPFAIGATAAAVLAWIGIAPVAQWLVFFGVSFIALAYLRQFIDRQDREHQPRVGANRWLDATGVVLEDIDPTSGTGMVRVENEEWRATASGVVPAGTRVVVREVRGARMVVVPLEEI